MPENLRSLPTVRPVPTARHVPSFANAPSDEYALDAVTHPRRSYTREIAQRVAPGERTSPEETRVSPRPRGRSDSQASAVDVPPRVIDDRYRVDALVGEGGMARVLLATHVLLGHQVCIKQMHSNLAQDPECVARFMREARASASLKSPNAIRVQDVGVSRSGVPYMIMERLDGCNLHDLVQDNGPRSAADVAIFILDACDAIGEAHTNGVVHRDIKPANLFLSQCSPQSRVVKVLDFGVASGAKGQGPDLTQPQAFLGSPQFMAPEQARCATAASPRSDVWSLGVTMYYLLTGEVPFSGPTVGAVLAAAQKGDYVPVETRRPDVPRFLRDAVHRCLSVDPLRRPVDANELGAILRAGQWAPAAPCPVASHAAQRAATMRVARKATTVERFARTMAIGAYALLTVAAAGGILGIAQETSSACIAALKAGH
jgi:serine/threonine protein kinase